MLFHALLVLNSSRIPLVKRSLEIKSNSLCPYNTGVASSSCVDEARFRKHMAAAENMNSRSENVEFM